MAAAATQTTHIRFNQTTRDANGNIFLESQDPLQFTAIPVIYPLVLAGGIGLLMWFIPAPLTAHKPARKKHKYLSHRRSK